jgi:ABC-type transport system involved in cytochrome c biogenesis permease component
MYIAKRERCIEKSECKYFVNGTTSVRTFGRPAIALFPLGIGDDTKDGWGAAPAVEHRG